MVATDLDFLTTVMRNIRTFCTFLALCATVMVLITPADAAVRRATTTPPPVVTTTEKPAVSGL